MLVNRQAWPATPALRDIADAKTMDFMWFERRGFTSVNANGAGSRAPKADNGVAQRRLAHAVAADDREHAAIEVQRDALDRVAFAVIDVQTVDLQRRTGGALSHV